MALAAGGAWANDFTSAIISMDGGPTDWTADFGTSHTDGLVFTDTYTFAYSGLPGSAQGYFLNVKNFTFTPASSIHFNWATLDGTALPIFNGVLSGSLFFNVPVSGLVTLIINGKDKGVASYSGTLDVTSPVPEPATYGMLLGGLALMGLAARRRKS
ncbi:FxDxF family PEP-CTERM protein [Duganella sp. S19_KUP01_CR8]|uniref:FxDxF family PEP-CTERM protein n=1 Tax=Duganella sp. S19_KUP01_CR8 TaxID=3025502 RepID=UPI002FCDA029